MTYYLSVHRNNCLTQALSGRDRAQAQGWKNEAGKSEVLQTVRAEDGNRGRDRTYRRRLARTESFPVLGVWRGRQRSDCVAWQPYDTRRTGRKHGHLCRNGGGSTFLIWVSPIPRARQESLTAAILRYARMNPVPALSRDRFEPAKRARSINQWNAPPMSHESASSSASLRWPGTMAIGIG
jgi:hypothetical protein